MTSQHQDDSLSAWEAFLTRQCAPHPIQGTDVSVTPFGAFVRLAEGVDGLLHRDQWAGTEPEVGSTVSVRLLELDLSRRRASLAVA